MKNLSHNTGQPANGLFNNFSSRKSVTKNIYVDRKRNNISISDIVMLEGLSNYTFVHLSSGEKVLVSKTIKEFEESLLDNGFSRIHKSFLINLNYLVSIETKGDLFVVLKTGQRVEISRRRKTGFQKEVLNFMKTM
ncbi:MAG: LytTR family DNA-binding domain-containing protein [Flectobacillus sp.]|nr:LytTR family DNA-binding domain-containing protein [Flectobacillus sp.]